MAKALSGAGPSGGFGGGEGAGGREEPARADQQGGGPRFRDVAARPPAAGGGARIHQLDAGPGQGGDHGRTEAGERGGQLSRGRREIQIKAARADEELAEAAG